MRGFAGLFEANDPRMIHNRRVTRLSMADFGVRGEPSGLYMAAQERFPKYGWRNSNGDTWFLGNRMPYISHLARCGASNPPYIGEVRGELGLWLGQMLLVGNGDAIGGIGDAGSGGGVGDALTHASLREKRRGKEARKEARKEGLVEGGKRGLREYGGKAEETAERNRKLRIETGKSGGYNKPV